ncbi:MAG: hypothetical protein LBK58_10875 [Prevotellaceae bacterium]|jgi:hypothetical protein|nr:hypothetical protein [Prevotellaceae bacterium]
MDNFKVKELLTGLPIVNHHAADMDVGSKEMVVTYTNSDGRICQFESGCFTGNLDETVHILQREGVTDAAMESTGIYGGSPVRKAGNIRH